MNSHRFYTIAVLLLVAAICAVLPLAADAAPVGTPAGTTISNSATVNYTVGGVPQSPLTSTANTFVVDRKINLTVTTLSNPTSVPSSTYQSMQFLVTNTSNTSIRFQLQPATVSGWTNTVTLSNLNIYRDSGSTPGAWDATDTLYSNAGTFSDIASGSAVTVLIVGDVPSGTANGVLIKYALLATAVDFGTLTVSTQTAGADTAGVDTLFADAAGTATGDASRDGKASSSSTLTVSAAGVTVTKAAAVYSDPYSGATSTGGTPKAIPGAVITYTVTVSNSTGGASASNVTVSDDLTAMIVTNTYISFNNTFADGTKTCLGGTDGNVISTDGGATWTCQAGNYNSGTHTLTVTVPGSIAAGSSAIIKYQVTIQ